MIQVGKYQAKAVRALFDQTSKGTPLVRVTFKLKLGEGQYVHADWEGFFSEKTEDKTLDALRACGCTFPGDDVFDVTGIEKSVVIAVVDYDKDESGQQSFDPETQEPLTKIRWINSAAEGLDSLRERLKGKLASQRVASGGGGAANARVTRTTPGRPASAPSGASTGGTGGTGGAQPAKQAPGPPGRPSADDGEEDEIPF